MGSKVDELFSLVEKTSERLGVMEKTISDLGRSRTEREERVVKALLDGRGVQGAVGFDGADTMSLIRTSSRGRQKSIGMGRYLEAVYAASHNKTSPGGVNPAQALTIIEKAGGKPIQKAALAEGSGATGGYTVPVQFYADLLREVAEEAFVRSRCTTIPMQSRSILVPALNQGATPATGTSAFFGGIAATWTPEAPAAGYSESEPTFRQIELVARDLVFITIASNQLLQDNAVALDTLLTTLFKEAMAWFYDYFILRGSGVSQPQGVLNSPATYLQAGGASSTFALVDAAAMMSRLLMSSWKNAIWAMHPSVIPQLITMADSTNGRLVWINQFPASGEGGGAAQSLPMTLFGLPIHFTEKLPALGTQGCVVLADLSKMLVGDRLAIQIETSPHYKFTTNQMVWRIVARWDAQSWLNTPITMADGSYTMSPFVQLKAAA